MRARSAGLVTRRPEGHTRVAAEASISAGFAQALTGVWNDAGAGAGRAAAIVLPLAALTAINIAGVKHGARTAVILVIGKLLPGHKGSMWTLGATVYF